MLSKASAEKGLTLTSFLGRGPADKSIIGGGGAAFKADSFFKFKIPTPEGVEDAKGRFLLPELRSRAPSGAEFEVLEVEDSLALSRSA